MKWLSSSGQVSMSHYEVVEQVDSFAEVGVLVQMLFVEHSQLNMTVPYIAKAFYQLLHVITDVSGVMLNVSIRSLEKCKVRGLPKTVEQGCRWIQVISY